MGGVDFLGVGGVSLGGGEVDHGAAPQHQNGAGFGWGRDPGIRTGGRGWVFRYYFRAFIRNKGFFYPAQTSPWCGFSAWVHFGKWFLHLMFLCQEGSSIEASKTIPPHLSLAL